VPILAVGQSPLAATAVQCVIPPLNFWSPPTNAGGITTVGVEFFIVDIIAIDDRQGQFTLDFTIGLTWQDSRLDSVAGNAQGCSSQLSEIWDPQLIFVNVAQPANDNEGLVDILPGGNVVYAKRITRRFTVDLKLQDFPFDKQELVVELASLIYGPDDVEFVATESAIGMLESAGFPGWRVGKL
jgi:hypothetical protein